MYGTTYFKRFMSIFTNIDQFLFWFHFYRFLILKIRKKKLNLRVKLIYIDENGHL